MSTNDTVLDKPISDFTNKNVKSVFDAYPKKMKDKMLFLRQLVFDTASLLEEVNEIEETLKWGEPSYLTVKPKCGSAIRMDWKDKTPDHYAMYFHCQTSLVSTFRELYPHTFKFEGNRAIVFNKNDEIPVDELSHCISIALTYHSSKKSK